MILSVSRRTDIPAYYSDWFFNRLKEGYALSRPSPYNYHFISKIPINPDIVDCIVFWTKNAAPMVDRLDELKDYSYYFTYTINSYGKDIEPAVPDREKVVIPAFKKISEKIGSDRVQWRYDPILFNEKYTMDFHIEEFTKLAKALKGYTEKCIISFVDILNKNRANMNEIKLVTPSQSELKNFAKKLADIARENGMTMASCAEEMDLSDCGIVHNCCIDKATIEKILGLKLKVGKDNGQRPACGCVESVDIGNNNSCKHGCIYCYATDSIASLKKACGKYDVNSPILCDALEEGDKITERKVKVLADRQMDLFSMFGEE